MSKLLTALVAAVSIAGATAVTVGPANAQWGGDWHVGGDYYYPSAYGYGGYGGYGYGGYGYGGYGYGGYGYGVGVATAPYAIVAVPTVSAVAVPAIPAVPAVPTYRYGYGGYGGYASAGYWPYRNLYSYAPGYYRRWYWQ
jgi:hypothetical protein